MAASSLDDLVFWLGVDLIAQTPEDPAADGGEALIKNLRLNPISEIMQRLLEESLDDTQTIEVFDRNVEQSLAHYHELYAQGFREGERTACLVELLVLDECLRCAIEHAGSNTGLVAALTEIRSRLPIQIGTADTLEMVASLPGLSDEHAARVEEDDE